MLGICSLDAWNLSLRHTLPSSCLPPLTQGYPIDLGGAWIHGQTGNPLTALAQTYRLATAASGDDNTLFSDTGALLPTSTVSCGRSSPGNHGMCEACYVSCVCMCVGGGVLRVCARMCARVCSCVCQRVYACLMMSFARVCVCVCVCRRRTDHAPGNPYYPVHTVRTGRAEYTHVERGQRLRHVQARVTHTHTLAHTHTHTHAQTYTHTRARAHTQTHICVRASPSVTYRQPCSLTHIHITVHVYVSMPCALGMCLTLSAVSTWQQLSVCKLGGSVAGVARPC